MQIYEFSTVRSEVNKYRVDRVGLYPISGRLLMNADKSTTDINDYLVQVSIRRYSIIYSVKV